jgi:hypothetical protein
MNLPFPPMERGKTVFLRLPQPLSMFQCGGATLDHCKNQFTDFQWAYSFVCGHPVSDWMSNWSRPMSPMNIEIVNLIDRKAPSSGGAGNQSSWAPWTATDLYSADVCPCCGG